MNVDKEQIKGHFESIILKTLFNEDSYGYEILKKIKEESDNNLLLLEGTLYVVLKRLEKNNFVISYWDDGNKSGARRRYYKITDSGKKYFYIKQKEWMLLKELLDKFYLGGHLFYTKILKRYLLILNRK